MPRLRAKLHRPTGFGRRSGLLALLVVAVVLPGCSGNGDPAGSPDPATSATDAGATTDTAGETETGPEPVTPGERRWARAVTRYIDRAERTIFHEGPRTITRASMRAEIALFDRCATTLRRAGDPGRYAPARRRVQRACRTLRRASTSFRRILAAGGPSFIEGSPGQQIIEPAFEAASEAQGNGMNALLAARDHIGEIERQLPKG